MLPSQIESWTLDIIERVEKKLPIEDSRVELKSTWVDPDKAARLIAAHANASRGEKILWLIGVDEKTGVVNTAHENLTNWLPKVQSYFVEVTPSVQDLNIPYKGKVVVALLFDTSRLPFLVKNPNFGKTNGGNISQEVPWREGISTRTANRSDLIRILVPQQPMPSLEIIDCNLTCTQASADQKENTWWLSIEMYVTPKTSDRLVLPFHRVGIEFYDKQEQVLLFKRANLMPPYTVIRDRYGGKSKIEYTSTTVQKSDSEVILNGPGKVVLEKKFKMDLDKLKKSKELTVTLSISPAGSDYSASSIYVLRRRETQTKLHRKGIYWDYWALA